MREKSPKTLLDFMAPELPEPSCVPAAAERGYEVEAGQKVLLLGRAVGFRPVKKTERAGELLLYCDRESEAVAARKAGDRAVLALTETMEDRERFDAIVQGDLSYRIHDPQRALSRMVRALRPSGRLLLELPLEGHWALSEHLLERAAEAEEMSCRVEKILRPDAEILRRALESLALETAITQVVYVTRWITADMLESWARRVLDSRALLLDESERRRLHRRFVKEMAGVCRAEDGLLLEEEAVMRIDARKSQESRRIFSSM